MKKPGKVTTSYYKYNELIKYIETKYKLKTRDYYGCFSPSREWEGPTDKEGNPPYADFWHWFIDCNGGNINNGCFAYIPSDLPWGEIRDDPTCYEQGHTPKFVMEIIELLKQEFGAEILTEKLWVEW